jgi:predicted metal-dependent peptidase
MCKDKPKKTFTLAQPNQDYMNMGMTLADRRAIGKPTHIAHVKFAIDVSGSVSQKELEVMLSEVNNIFTHYKVDGELIYWSTNIGDAGMFSNLHDMLKVKPESTGGTDVRCVFEYLSGETKVHGKTEQDKVRDIKGVFIITDGCFSNDYADYEKMFGKRVVWLITGQRGNPITFNPPFGKVIGLNMEF